MLKELKVRTAQKGKKAAIKDVLERHWARENSLLEIAVYTYKGGSLRTSLQIGCLRALINYGYKALTK